MRRLILLLALMTLPVWAQFSRTASRLAGGAVLPTQVSFAPGTTSVDIEVSSGGATVQAPVTVSVSAGPSAPPIIDATYLLNPSGETVITLTPPGGPFAAGDYSVAITANGLRLGATAFDVR